MCCVCECECVLSLFWTLSGSARLGSAHSSSRFLIEQIIIRMHGQVLEKRSNDNCTHFVDVSLFICARVLQYVNSSEYAVWFGLRTAFTTMLCCYTQWNGDVTVLLFCSTQRMCHIRMTFLISGLAQTHLLFCFVFFSFLLAHILSQQLTLTHKTKFYLSDQCKPLETLLSGMVASIRIICVFMLTINCSTHTHTLSLSHSAYGCRSQYN